MDKFDITFVARKPSLRQAWGKQHQIPCADNFHKKLYLLTRIKMDDFLTRGLGVWLVDCYYEQFVILIMPMMLFLVTQL
mgnify:FL=1